MKWWEKTVEYYFIRKFVPEDMILSPLDGVHEKAGDALLSNSEKWVILEFKKDFQSLASERKKYKNYKAALLDLMDQDSHHFLVYGEFICGRFDLVIKTYFSNKSVSNIDKIVGSGKLESEFISYLERLVKHKSKGSGASAGSVGSYSFVAGINKENKITSCMSLHEFGLHHGLSLESEPELKQEKSKDYNGPSIGR